LQGSAIADSADAADAVAVAAAAAAAIVATTAYRAMYFDYCQCSRELILKTTRKDAFAFHRNALKQSLYRDEPFFYLS
jgi:hypothetical protein